MSLLQLDTAWGKARLADGTPLRLTGAQYRALALLASRAGETVSKADLSLEALGVEWTGGRGVEQLVMVLRRVLPRDPDGEWLVHTMANGGFMLPLGAVTEA